jgi:hypothetical protein
MPVVEEPRYVRCHRHRRHRYFLTEAHHIRSVSRYCGNLRMAATATGAALSSRTWLISKEFRRAGSDAYKDVERRPVSSRLHNLQE